MNLAVTGSIDHGKSTLIGRLLYDTNSLPDGKVAELEAACKVLDKPFEIGYVVDVLEEERRDSMTVDTCRVPFSYQGRDYVIIDTPGHVEFLKSMFTGASRADAAVLLVDAVEGVTEQTRRHVYLLEMLGIQQIVVVVNKMDLVDYSTDVYRKVTTDIGKVLTSAPTCVVPISAKHGYNVVTPSDSVMYDGPTLLDALDALQELGSSDKLPLRFAVQYIHKGVVLGRVESGTLRQGSYVWVLPNAFSIRIDTLVDYGRENVPEAPAGKSIGVITNYKLRRGHILADGQVPMRTDVRWEACIFWMREEPFYSGGALTCKCVTQETRCKLSITSVVDPITLKKRQTTSVRVNDIAYVVMYLDHVAVFDPFRELPPLGRFVLTDNGSICAGGIVL